MARQTPWEQLASRVARLESQSAGNERLLGAQIRELDARLRHMTSAARENLLDPGALHTLVGGDRREGSLPRTPDMGSPLINRLRSDPLLGISAQGRSVPFAGTGNLLRDPVFESVRNVDTNLFPLLTLTGAYQAQGTAWEAKFTSTGSAPTVTDWYGLGYQRTESYLGPISSSGASSSPTMFEFGWASGGQGTADLFLRNRATSAGLSSDSRPAAAYLIASCRLATGTFAITQLTQWDAWMEIVDTGDNVLATGDTVDLLAADAEQSTPIIYCSLASPTVDGTERYRFRLRVQMTKTGTGEATLMDTLVYEPSFNLSDEDAPQSFQPAIGAWSPRYLWHSFFHGSPSFATFKANGIGADQNDYAPADWFDAPVHHINPTGATRTVTGFARPVWGDHSTMRIILNISTQDLVLAHESASSTAANRIRCPGSANLTVRKNGGVMLMWSAEDPVNAPTTTLRWRVVSP